MTDDNSLYYMRNRYYNPDIKRFINQDVLIGSISNSNSLNRYSYVEGNPVSYTDPFGLSPYGNFGTFLTVMKFMSQIDIMSLVHVTLSALGALP
ncbi:MAG: RHS repeat-associated core domain-containing protein, partial [Lachnospiraceae bacterium]|nr:RHS repeat-associated core domain-containing protein [Lachnospiraceae bacterium]